MSLFYFSVGVKEVFAETIDASQSGDADPIPTKPAVVDFDDADDELPKPKKKKNKVVKF